MRITAVFASCTTLAALFVVGACGSGTAPDAPAGLMPDTARVPLTQLGTATYRGFQGGLYPGGSNTVPATHAALGTTFARNIRPLNAAGQPDANGKVVLLSVGMSNTTQEFCGGGPISCQSISFVGQALADPTVDRAHLVLVDGAQGGKVIVDWDNTTDATYTAVRDTRLAALGVTEAQVQAVWLKQATPGPRTSLPDASADAYTIVAGLGDVVRTLKRRYPNLQLFFLSSRIYAGYAQPGTLNPEPFAYETGFAVKWLMASSGCPEIFSRTSRTPTPAPGRKSAP